MKTNDIYIFMGNMNSMPMMYARELKSRGSSVFFFVDAKKNNYLCRPEATFSDIKYPYPEWIIEKVVLGQLVVALFPKIFSIYYRYIFRRIIGRQNNSHYVLNGFFVSLAPYLKKTGKVTCLSHGSDLDTWADIKGLPTLQVSFRNRSFLKFLPSIIAKSFISLAVKNQLKGFECAKSILYFPKGFNSKGDKVIQYLEYIGVNHIPVRGFSSSSLIGGCRDFRKNSNKLVIFSAVRFIFHTFPDANPEYNKGNDIIIKGLAKFVQSYKNIEIHFVEKGEDVDLAKELCRNLDLSPYVIWHKEMSFIELLNLYEASDICFDQVGTHWIGAVGGYALWFGKPLIANVSREVAAGVWPQKNPVLQASNEDDIFLALVHLTSEENRKAISDASKKFFDDYLDFSHVVDELF
jgi:glycosyltransferase involved in cell wall biosynthesis